MNRPIPLGAHILVHPEPDAPPSAMLLIPTSTGHTAHATVLACGPEVRDVQIGQRVIISRLQGTLVGEDLLIPESAVLAYCEATGEFSNDPHSAPTQVSP